MATIPRRNSSRLQNHKTASGQDLKDQILSFVLALKMQGTVYGNCFALNSYVIMNSVSKRNGGQKMVPADMQTLIAPCGMNCALCSGYQRKKNHCAGCNAQSEEKVAHCATCSIRHCQALADGQAGFCYACSRYPCRRLKQLDKRYVTKYAMSMLENQAFIRDMGMDAFLSAQEEQWTCKTCGELLCVHKGVCLTCKPNG